MDSMNDFIRGGQVTFHKYRMLGQVTKLLCRLAFVLLFFSIAYSFYKNISLQEWKIGLTWLKTDIVSKVDDKVVYTNNYGISKKVSIKVFKNDPFVTNTIKKFEVTLYRGLNTAVLMLSIILGGLLLFFFLKGKYIKRSIHLRGIFILSNEELKKSINKHNREFKNYVPFTIADFAYPITGRKESWTAGEQTHTMLIGSTGAGKTKIIQQLVYQLYQRRQKAIIIDIKGDYIEHFYQPKKGDIILNPLDKRGRNWSIFVETNPLKGFSTIAKSLLPKESKNDPIWVDSARNVLSELANLYVSENLSMAEFADKILKTDIITLSQLLQNTGAAKIVNPDIEKAALSVLMVLSTYLRPLKLYKSNKDIFSITKWINDDSQNNFLFISSKTDAKEDLNPIITCQVDIAINALRSLKAASSTPKVWFILDEIPYFDQAIPSLKDGLAMARGHGGCFVLGTQDMSSLSKIYSEETTRSIANNCRTKIYMNVSGKETAHWCSGAIGEGEIEEWHEGLSYGAHEMRDGIQVNRNKVIRSAVLPSEFMTLKTGEGYISFAGFKPAKFRFEDCSFKKISSGFVENNDLLELLKQELAEGEKRRKKIESKILGNEHNEKNIEKEIQLSKNNKLRTKAPKKAAAEKNTDEFLKKIDQNFEENLNIEENKNLVRTNIAIMDL